MTPRQYRMRVELRKRNSRRLRRQRTENRIRQAIPTGYMHKTDPTFINADRNANFTLCGESWSPRVRSSLFIDADVTCRKCLSLMVEQDGLLR